MVAGPLLPLAAALATMAAAIAAAVLARGTTAVPAAWWAAAAAAAAAFEWAVRASGGLLDPASQSSARLLVVSLSLCPIMSLLGAKRPQHGVWQFIVATLAVVVAMPALSATLVRPGSPPDVHPLRRWLLLALAIVSVLNFIATRHGVAAAAVVAGQTMLMRAFLPFGDPAAGSTVAADTAGATLVAIGSAAAVFQSAARSWSLRRMGQAHEGAGGSVPDPAALIGIPFLALRETVGAAWALRIAERFNGVAESRGWPCRLRFDGLHVGGDPDDAGWHADSIRAARALFQRFVSSDWLERHGGRPKS